MLYSVFHADVVALLTVEGFLIGVALVAPCAETAGGAVGAVAVLRAT
jgi:hypothetical protein